ncbi:fumarylacetoacetate hydrolase family protein [Sphingorhabdus sp. YGSMI21]|uniref:fumarylacetoacetate hydrolase family protein n=1 Tax=Sphingorhabdus sp. YGSMI21 TaxID=2077182 RepID=UPI000C1EEA72|nr:fumarylacetoacetate hydrolase family protein [Sphingorhabdus sp. YGSMI21]ATW03518.1 5-oxopent-3-ene-1,2,5-tricarboxylate decarboxylase [Sphingorhabdus sp. YGSMI21]
MQLVNFRRNGANSLGFRIGDEIADLTEVGGPASIDQLLASGSDAMAACEALSSKAVSRIPLSGIEEWLPPVLAPAKAIAIGLNYVEHAKEGAQEVPSYPVMFSRYPSSWVGHNAPIIQPRVSKILDYEGEMAVIIGKPGKYISREDALAHVAGYSIFNEGSIRDYQMRTHQWTIGKNFDRSGSFGPYFVSADEVPAGASGLRLQTRLNGKIMQDANTSDMIFDVATLVATLSEVMALAPGDVIISGTPEGVGAAHKPPVFMQPGDVCEVSIEGIGVLSNPIELEASD